jgi:hypothetical protein
MPSEIAATVAAAVAGEDISCVPHVDKVSRARTTFTQLCLFLACADVAPINCGAAQFEALGELYCTLGMQKKPLPVTSRTSSGPDTMQGTRELHLQRNSASYFS